MSDKSKISTLVINLSNATERWDFQKKQLDRLKLPYQRWEATTVSSLTDDEYEKWANDWQRKLRMTEVACFLSHYQVWQYIAENNTPFLVLEDDALLSEQLPMILTQLDHKVFKDYHHVTFEARGRKKLISKKSVAVYNDIALHHLFLDKTGAAAYLLTPEGAKILIHQVDKHGAGLADALLCHTKPLKSIQSVPALAIQMDMAKHYNMPELQINPVAASNISTLTSSKPSPNSLSDKLAFKSKRLAAQLDIGLIQAKKSNQSNYLEVQPNQSHFSYLKNLFKLSAS